MSNKPKPSKPISLTKNHLIVLDDYRRHMAGYAICFSCRYSWFAIMPTVCCDVTMLECSKCGKQDSIFVDQNVGLLAFSPDPKIDHVRVYSKNISERN